MTASDPDGDDLTYGWSAPTSGWSISANDDPTKATLTAPEARGKTGTVEVTVSDDFGGETTNELLVNTAAE